MNKEKFLEQKTFVPLGENWPQEGFRYESVIVGGMGGSALAARLMFALEPAFPLWLHNDYGVPEKASSNTLSIAMSYSGNTGEVLSFAKKTLEKGAPLAIVTSGGKLLEMAREENLPYVLVPFGLEPRNAVLYMMRALLFVLGKNALLEELESIPVEFERWQKEGAQIGENLGEDVPLIYSSRNNHSFAYLWKIMLNETGKIHAFTNIFPELAHNEIESLMSKSAAGFKALLFIDEEDSTEVRHAMNTLANLMSEKNIKFEKAILPLGRIQKLLYALVASQSAALAIAEANGIDAGATPSIKLLKESL
jgi:glucose/mannose-6-phosphate isomerase